jgi:hypothetical protein
VLFLIFRKETKGAALGTRHLLKKVDENFYRKKKKGLGTEILSCGRVTATKQKGQTTEKACGSKAEPWSPVAMGETLFMKNFPPIIQNRTPQSGKK